MTDDTIIRNILFITHDTGIYGASRSLQLLIANYPQKANIYLMTQNKISLKNKNDAIKISQQFSVKKENIFFFNLPSKLCVLLPKEGLKAKIARFIINARFFITQQKFKQFIHKSNFDIIHINSLTLLPIVSRNLPFIVHAREYFLGTKFFNPLHKFLDAKGVIFIDESTKKPFQNMKIPKHRIIPNPVDVQAVMAKWSREEAQNELKLNFLNATLFSVIGRVDLYEDKGVGFIISSFKKIKDSNIRLLIFGFATQKVHAECCQLIGNDTRIILCGEHSDQGLIYTLSDVVLRGETEFRVGRTHLEALYAGCRIIIPGQAENLEKDSELRLFKESIFTYPPRDEKGFMKSLQNNLNYQRKACLPGNQKKHAISVKLFFDNILEASAQ